MPTKTQGNDGSRRPSRTRSGAVAASAAKAGHEVEVEPGLVRLNVNLNAETAAALRELAAEKGISFTEAVRRAIAVYKFVEDEVEEGRRVQTVDRDAGTVRELVLM